MVTTWSSFNMNFQVHLIIQAIFILIEFYIIPNLLTHHAIVMFDKLIPIITLKVTHIKDLAQ